MTSLVGTYRGLRVTFNQAYARFELTNGFDPPQFITEDEVMRAPTRELAEFKTWLQQRQAPMRGPTGQPQAPIFPNKHSASWSQEVLVYLADLPNDSVLLWVNEFQSKRTGNAGGGGGKRFTYLALKAQGQWYTTASDANTRVGQIMDNGALTAILAADDTVQISVLPTRWTQLI